MNTSTQRILLRALLKAKMDTVILEIVIPILTLQKAFNILLIITNVTRKKGCFINFTLQGVNTRRANIYM